ncbi:hypothetical protein M569_02808 [Genlisea aurea]|uniref:Pentacotripeptide-repeat region of PRORP domain-containing protein n=1 Tax=Genlisea aurea TaxID=192259 RepID=S8CY81_9LAMI|nr:hypothetical protein M569_02808 [Genlisea aurea]
MVLLCRLTTPVNFRVIFRKRFLRLYASPNLDFNSRSGSEFEIGALVDKIGGLNDELEVFQSLVQSPGSETVQFNDSLVSSLLNRFQDDWKSALGVFRWIESCSLCKPNPLLYNELLDILGKARQMEKMKNLLAEMHKDRIVSLDTIAKAMRRFAGSRDWRSAVELFDDLESYGLARNTESMNILLDTLCKEQRVFRARSIFLRLKPHIPPNANTFNILIHGWCKANRVEEAVWTVEEMKGHGFRPCIITHSTIIRFHCRTRNFGKVFEALEEMKSEGCAPNVVTFTIIMDSLAKSGNLEEALQVPEKMNGCKPDTRFYNVLIHTLGRAGKVDEAVAVLEKEMPLNGVRPSTSTYNTVISILCHHRQEKRALEYLEESGEEWKPDLQSFHPLFKSCFRCEMGFRILSRLLKDAVEKHNLCLDLGSFTLLIHGFCRRGQCELAYELFREMVGRNLVPRYKTCSLLLHEIREKCMYDAADMVEDFMNKMKSIHR